LSRWYKLHQQKPQCWKAFIFLGVLAKWLFFSSPYVPVSSSALFCGTVILAYLLFTYWVDLFFSWECLSLLCPETQSINSL